MGLLSHEIASFNFNNNKLTIFSNDFEKVYKKISYKFSKCKYVVLTKFNNSIDFIANITTIIEIDFNSLSIFNYPIYQLPKNLKKLNLSQCFDQSELNLPNSLTHLIIGYAYKKPIDNLPKNLKELEIKSRFSHNLDNLPNGLIKLSVNNLTYNIISKYDKLPNSLLYLIIYTTHRKINLHNLPKLRNLIIECKNCLNLSLYLPLTLKYFKIIINSNAPQFPIFNSTLEQLIIISSYSNVEYKLPLDILYNTSSLQHLLIGGNLNYEVNNLPNSLIKLFLGEKFNNKVDNLPNSLLELELGNNFNSNVDNLPTKLISFIVGCSFNQNINSLPNTLKYLQLGRILSYNNIILPPLLKKINYIKRNNICYREI